MIKIDEESSTLTSYVAQHRTYHQNTWYNPQRSRNPTHIATAPGAFFLSFLSNVRALFNNVDKKVSDRKRDRIFLAIIYFIHLMMIMTMCYVCSACVW